MTNTTESGAAAELVAQRFYEARGYELLARNFRTRWGEIDLIFLRKEELLFVEVKGRRIFRVDEAWWARWREKKRKIRVVASFFLAQEEKNLPDFQEIRLEITYVTQGRVTERFEGEPFF